MSSSFLTLTLNLRVDECRADVNEMDVWSTFLLRHQGKDLLVDFLNFEILLPVFYELVGNDRALQDT